MMFYLRNESKISLGQKIHFGFQLLTLFSSAFFRGISIWVNQILVLSLFFFFSGFCLLLNSPVLSNYSNNSQEVRESHEANQINTSCAIQEKIVSL